ncbi:dTMP kinase [Oscillibacter sp.]|uniref:dTMP kinase n=1 Tax=Oscillibacter sp. TaxID=1945593 RepID=UPI001B51A30B|nr:deoxynucleoside kinase [Oscillibacter sp.]MBP3508655.1 deoxynucleoside kinase [Oscillibacter sp.]
MSGKLIVFEGTDGSGKATQSKLLCSRLEAEGIPFRKIDFPRYGKPSAAMVQEYLNGNLGKKPGDVNAYAASMFFSMDRYASYQQDWGDFYEAGGLVVADRYTTSNAVHQASKLLKSERKEYLDWLFELEYGKLGLPKPDLVIYLDMPTEITEQMMRQREQATGTHADIHEQDETYLKNCRANAKEIVKECGWSVLNCAKDGNPRTPEDIHAQVYRLVKKLL